VPSHTLLLLYASQKGTCIAIQNYGCISTLCSSLKIRRREGPYSRGCLISETQEPQWRCRTPRNFFGCTIFLELRFSVMEVTRGRDVELCWGASELKCVAVWGRNALV
jgi:hypothetical protein